MEENTTRYMYSNCQRYTTICGYPRQSQLEAFETLDLQPPMEGWMLSNHCEFIIFLNYDHPVNLPHENFQNLLSKRSISFSHIIPPHYHPLNRYTTNITPDQHSPDLIHLNIADDEFALSPTNPHWPLQFWCTLPGFESPPDSLPSTTFPLPLQITFSF